LEQIQTILEQYYEQFPFNGNLVFIDVETTGFEKNARLIEIGALGTLFDGNKVKIETFESLIHPGVQIKPKITEVTGITNEELKDARSDIVYSEFEAWINKIQPKRMIAHNAKFDKAKLEYNLARVNINPAILFPNFICTMNMSKKKIPSLSANNLKAVCDYFGYQNRSAHRALADTESCAYIYCRMMLLPNAGSL
jgi:DNA polymerase-3 subunit alpha (Gram-positive type)